MNEGAIIGIVSLIGCLALAGSALASYKLSWGKVAQIGLTWIAIFAGMFALFNITGFGQ